DPITNEHIRKMLQEIAQRKTEYETEGLAKSIDEAELHKAIAAVETQAQEADIAGKPVSRALDRLEQPIMEANLVARSWDRAVAFFRSAVDELSIQSTPTNNELTAAAMSLGLQAGALKSAAQETSTAFTSERLRLDERRYQREADDNRVVAGL